MVRVGTASPTSSPRVTGGRGTPKLRRKIPADVLKDSPEVVQRLVEYFVVVTSQPRWKQQQQQQQHPQKHEPSSPSSPSSRSSSPTKHNFKTDATAPKSNGNIHLPSSAPTAAHHEYTFQPKITARYPVQDYPDNPLNDMITHFCYPHSEMIEPSSNRIKPRVHYFVLTNERGRKVYGTCLTVYEEYHPTAKGPYSQTHTVHHSHLDDSDDDNIEVTVDQGKSQALYIPKVLCILSTWPYLLAFREYLSQLYRIATSTILMEVPIERFVQNLCHEIPAPPPGAFELDLNLLDSGPIKFWAPPANQPVAYVSLPYQILFECLDLDSILVVWYALLLEQKVLLVSSQHSILTVCAEVLQSLLFPLQWSHLYIPLLPCFLSPMLDAPIPYLCGVIRENWSYAECHLSSETIVVDLDSNTVMFGSDTPQMPSPPIKKWTKLKVGLEEAVGDLFWKTRGMDREYYMLRKGRLSQQRLQQIRKEKGNAGWKEKLQEFDQAFSNTMEYSPDSPNLVDSLDEESEQSRWEQVQEAFLRFFVSALKSYRKFLHMPEEGIMDTPGRWNHKSLSFDRDGYIAWQKEEAQPFYRDLCMTQQFDDFITKRLYSPGEPDVIFFDQSIDSKLNRSKLRMKKVETPFLLNAKAHRVLKTVHAVEPTNEGLGDVSSYQYTKWPDKFDPALFGAPRPIPRIITAEFDRQASLVARLRAMNPENAQGADFLDGNFDVSPEVAAFTVFFFTYGAVVGLDWLAFQDAHARLQSGLSEDKHSEKSDPRTAATEVESEGGGCEGLLFADTDCADGLVFSETGMHTGMILNLPGWGLCDRCSKKNDEPAEYTAVWKVAPDDSPPRQQSLRNLLDLDEDHLEKYEEAKSIASAQLDLAFDALATVSMRSLPTDPDAFKSLMEACGRCGNTSRAVQLIQVMKRDGCVADSEIYSYFLSAFARDESLEDRSLGMLPRRGRMYTTDAYSAFLKKKFRESKAAASGDKEKYLKNYNDDDSLFSQSSDGSQRGPCESWFMTDMINAMFSSTKSLKKRKKKKNHRSTVNYASSSLPITDRMLKQVILGESLLTYLYPDVSIDTHSNYCPHCSAILTEDDIVAGWTPCEFQDFNTECPQCRHRFVPTFTVSCSSPEFTGSQGKSTPLYCEFLSPWVLRKELESVIHGLDGIEGMLAPQWRDGTDIRATLWWNLIVTFQRFRLPLAFLLQGSFHNRLIHPTPS